MTFYVGQKVVCVECDMRWNWVKRLHAWLLPYAGGLPKVDAIYTVSNVGIADSADGLVEFLELFELPAPAGNGWVAGFNAACFRPVVGRSTDISIFTEILNRENAKKQRVKVSDHQS